jgi:E3 ubiquitin-protein ligase UBR1
MVSPGNSGCCDCGDPEAWRIPVKCAIHTAAVGHQTTPMDTDNPSGQLPPDLVRSIRSTIARVLDYICDVISCSPEQLRLPKTEEGIRKDEEQSRLTSRYYGPEIESGDVEFALILWNDEKHTITDVQNQVSRACKETVEFGKLRAHETNNTGRSVVRYSTDVPLLLEVSRIIEQIKVTTTIRSSRDTFREQMCGTMIEWLEDIAGCSVGGDHNIFRTTICEELLGVWRVGSKASDAEIGKLGIDDHSCAEEKDNINVGMSYLVPMELVGIAETEEAEDMDVDIDRDGEDDEELFDDLVVADRDGESDDDNPRDRPLLGGLARYITTGGLEVLRPLGVDGAADRQLEDRHPTEDQDSGTPRIPRTPVLPRGLPSRRPAPSYWSEKPAGHSHYQLPPHEDLRQRVRLDWLVMFDLRLWKKARVGLRDLYISTVVVIPEFKRILGLRFAGLYPILAELYLVADREPDHSIINLSLQMLTTPTITAEVVRRGNFLTTLMAIVYTFLTTRQVGHPSQVNPAATLAFDGGPNTNPLTNRRMYHFFHDMRYLMASDYVQERLRLESRYAFQFLDLARLHQGICPNVRAVAEHVEYEAEAWISASVVTREINKLSRQFAEAFRPNGPGFQENLPSVIAIAARYAAVNSMGWESTRFLQSEMKGETEFKRVGDFRFDTDRWNKPNFYKIVKFCVDKQAISFHHALHYTLSWLIEVGKAMSNEQLRSILLLDWDQLRDYAPASAVELEPEDIAVAMFDFPLRVSVWLSQMKTGMWVRNGFSLRHQMQTYRSVSQRDLTHHRDVFLLQTAMVTVNPSRMLVSMIDRFNLNQWMRGNYATPAGYDEAQVLDLAEDFLHMLIVILSDRLPLIPLEEEPDLQTLRIRRELVHILCFKPMQYSEISKQIPERLQDNDKFQQILSEITNYRGPDGLSGYGTFSLKEEYLEEVDPYIAQFTKNQREEIEANYRARMAKKTGKSEADIGFEPRLRPINTGAFKDIASFTRTSLFAQIIYYSLSYALQFKSFTPGIQETRVEIFLQLCLHLCQLAVLEDNSLERKDSTDSFISHALEKEASPESEIEGSDNGHRTIATVLYRLASMESFKACWPKINHILRTFRQKKPDSFAAVAAWADGMGEGMEMDDNNLKELEEQRKKQLGKLRQAEAMARMKQQQQVFMDTAGVNFEDDFSDTESDEGSSYEEKKLWRYPTGTCILCQEEMNDSRLYGTLAFITESSILRQTDPTDADYMYEVVKTPESLDRDATDIRPFGVASMNRRVHKKLSADGSEISVERQGLGRGFPSDKVKYGPIITGCSHLMHFSCFEHYCESTRRRHPFQIARQHPERLEKKEFVCPLCKALGNTFLPIIWKYKEETLTGGALQPAKSFANWLTSLGPAVGRLEKAVGGGDAGVARLQGMFLEYCNNNAVVRISSKLQQLSPPRSEAIPDPWSRPPIASDSPSTAPHPPAPRAPSTPLEELQKTYLRLRDTFKDNKIPSALLSYDPTDLTHCDSLVRSLGFSISAVEIAQRGVASEPGFTLLDKIPTQVVTHLRILSETISSYFAVGGLRNRGIPTQTLQQFMEMERDELQRLFIGHEQLFDDQARTQIAEKAEPLLSSDPFLFLAECSVCAVPAFSWDIHHVVRLCYIAEIVKAVVVFGRDSELPDILRAWEESERLADIEGSIGYTELQLDTLQQFSNFVEKSLSMAEGSATHSSFALAVFRRLIESYATPFLRKCVILLHTRFGVLFPPSGFAEVDESEQLRLSNVLRLPSIDQIFGVCLADTEEGVYLRGIISGWCRHLSTRKTPVTMSHPAIFELVGLPRTFDILVDEAMKRRCPTTGSELTDPSVCLLCGEIFCSQALCCSEKVGNETDGYREIGGCNRHIRK